MGNKRKVSKKQPRSVIIKDHPISNAVDLVDRIPQNIIGGGYYINYKNKRYAAIRVGNQWIASLGHAILPCFKNWGGSHSLREDYVVPNNITWESFLSEIEMAIRLGKISA